MDWNDDGSVAVVGRNTASQATVMSLGRSSRGFLRQLPRAAKTIVSRGPRLLRVPKRLPDQQPRSQFGRLGVSQPTASSQYCTSGDSCPRLTMQFRRITGSKECSAPKMVGLDGLTRYLFNAVTLFERLGSRLRMLSGMLMHMYAKGEGRESKSRSMCSSRWVYGEGAGFLPLTTRAGTPHNWHPPSIFGHC